MILISHHNGDGDTTPVAIIDDNERTTAHIDKVIIESLADWCCPPEGNYTLCRNDNNPLFINIKYEGDYIDYDGDGTFELREVPVK